MSNKDITRTVFKIDDLRIDCSDHSKISGNLLEADNHVLCKNIVKLEKYSIKLSDRIDMLNEAFLCNMCSPSRTEEILQNLKSNINNLYNYIESGRYSTSSLKVYNNEVVKSLTELALADPKSFDMRAVDEYRISPYDAFEIGLYLTSGFAVSVFAVAVTKIPEMFFIAASGFSLLYCFLGSDDGIRYSFKKNIEEFNAQITQLGDTLDLIGKAVIDMNLNLE